MREQTAFHVNTPRSMAALLEMYEKHPESLIMGGGTYLLKHKIIGKEHYRVLGLDQIEELHRMSRNERHIELGSCITINEMIDSGYFKRIPIILETLENMGPHPIRNMATIGGNLCIPGRRLDLFPILTFLDAQLELRSLRKSRGSRRHQQRWVSPGSLLGSSGQLELLPGEVLTRVRIPYYDGNFYFHKKISLKGRVLSIINAVAKLEAGEILDIRIIFTDGSPFITRSREMETYLLGQTFPMAREGIDRIMQNFFDFFTPGDKHYEEFLMPKIFRQLLESLGKPRKITGDQ